MLQDQFTSRLLFIVVLGVAYIYAMMKMASCNSAETAPQKHIVLKIICIINVLLSVLCLVAGIFWLTQVQYPERSIDFSYSVNQIVRTSDKYVVWGYPTPEQRGVISCITIIFSSLALAAYCFYFKKSDRKWWKKILRFLYGLLMLVFYCSATDFHYFDAQEMVAPGLFCLMAWHAVTKAKKLNKQKKQLAEQQKNVAVFKEMDEKRGADADTEDDTHFMPQLDVNKTNKESEVHPADLSAQTSISQAEQDNKEETANDSIKAIKYCRHCGKKVDYDSSTYCKYCGKEL